MSAPTRITVFHKYPDYIWVLSDDTLAGGTTLTAEVPDAHWGTAKSKGRAIEDAKRQCAWLRNHSHLHTLDIVHEEIIHR